ncbi:MAG: toprim domain-containing protein, partial [Prevotella sp.]|nr:toprim domain-containing protein [Prevotella sp.]
KKDNGDVCDRYYGRVIFPWLSVSGKVCAFGGRVLDSRTKGVQQKYVNSPESEIYHKGNELYGIFQAKRSIVQHDMVYMVEGYTDVVSMHQCGIENVVANSGTALSKHQIRLLHRFTSNITLLYDGDEAGIHAALRGTDMLLEEGMNIRVVLFPDGDDPDSFARKHTAEEYQKFIDDNSQDFIAFKIHLLLDGVTDPIRKAEAISSIVESVSKIDDSIKRSTYIKECSQRIGINEQALIASMNRFIHTHIEEKEKRARSNEAVTSSQPPRGEESDTHSGHIVSSRGDSVEGTSNLEYLIMREIVQHGQTVLFNDVETTEGKRIKLDVVHFIDYDMKEDDMQFRNPTYNRILQMAVEYEGSVPLTTFLVNNPDIEISRIAADMAVERYHLSKYLEQESSADEIYRQVRHMLVDFKLERFEEKITFLKAELKEVSGDLERTSSILNELNLCQQQRNMLAKDVGKNILK